MKFSKFKKFVVGLFVVFLYLLVVGGFSAWVLLDGRSSLDEASAKKATLEWARLEAFPETVTHLKVEVLGGPFSREFVVTFTDTPQNIASWLASCPGPSSVSGTIGQHGETLYVYQAGGGAQYAEVRVSQLGEVRIRTYWS